MTLHFLFLMICLSWILCGCGWHTTSIRMEIDHTNNLFPPEREARWGLRLHPHIGKNQSSLTPIFLCEIRKGGSWKHFPAIFLWVHHRFWYNDEMLRCSDNLDWNKGQDRFSAVYYKLLFWFLREYTIHSYQEILISFSSSPRPVPACMPASERWTFSDRRHSRSVSFLRLLIIHIIVWWYFFEVIGGDTEENDSGE